MTEFKHTSMLMSEGEQLSSEYNQRAWKELQAENSRLKAENAELKAANTITIDGNEFATCDLLQRAIASIEGPSKYRSKHGIERWVLVKNMFCVGSTVAHGLCREFHFDPNEALRS